MSDPWKKPVSGEEFHPSASQFGHFIDAARANHQRAKDPKQPLELDAGIVLVRNDTGADLTGYRPVIGLGPPLIRPDQRPNIVLTRPLFSGVDPDDDAWAVLEGPLGAGKTCRAVASGVAWVLVEIVNELHQYCTAQSGSANLVSANQGSGFILWRGSLDSGSGSGGNLRWCIVRVSNPQDGESDAIGSTDGSGNPSGSGDVSGDPSGSGDDGPDQVPPDANGDCPSGYYKVRETVYLGDADLCNLGSGSTSGSNGAMEKCTCKKMSNYADCCGTTSGSGSSQEELEDAFNDGSEACRLAFGLYHTGEEVSAGAECDEDDHWTSAGANTGVKANGVAGPWIANNATSKWLHPVCDAESTELNEGETTYTLEFEIPEGTDLSAVRIVGRMAGDDSISHGVYSCTPSDPGVSTECFTEWTYFEFDDPQIGTNTAEFVVNNELNQTGVRVEWSAQCVE